MYGFVALVGLSLATMVVRWLAANWWLLVVLLVAAGAVGGLWLRRQMQRARSEQVRMQGLRYVLPQLDALSHRDFEHAVRDLMRRDGCEDARQVGGAGDNGADVKATDPFGRLWVIQCKHRRDGDRSSAIGTPDLQVLNGTARPVHGADVVVLVTNGRISSRGPAFARSQGIHLVDRRVLGEWAASGRPLWELLQVMPPPRRASPLS
ncbi:restriction endonuclease [Streptomyces sp. NBC_01231]|nr:restriction endonuclease [Streptomyces sp. NBC_01231]